MYCVNLIIPRFKSIPFALDDIGSPEHVMQVTPLQGSDCGEGRRFRRMDCHDTRGNLVDSR